MRGRKKGRRGSKRGGIDSVSKKRIKISLFLIVLLFGVYLFRSAQISLFSDDLREKVLKQSRTKITVEGKRGKILARGGEVLAKDIPSFSIWINPISISKSKKKVRAVYLIGKKLGIPRSQIKSKLGKELYFVWLKRQVDEGKFRKVMEIAKLYGLKRNEFGYIKEWKRFYPYGKITAHITGFVGVDSRGLAGLELEFDGVLRGGRKKIVVLRDALGRIIMNFPPEPPAPGNNIITTIDIDLQVSLFREMERRMRELSAKGAFAVAMNPKGEILAAVSLPSYDPNRYSKYAGSSSMLARFYQTIFEPGSIFKVFTIAVALEENVVKPEDVFFCYEGRWEFRGKVIRDVEKIGYANLREILAHSSNICAAQISLIIGSERFWRYLDRLGFGKKTGIELPGEEEGILHKPRKWREIDLASIGFGHFIGVTGIQMLRAFSALVGGGYLIRPFLVRKIVSPSGEIITEKKPKFEDKVFSPRVVKILQDMMREVVLSGTGKRAEISAYPVAGKTGTSRKVEGGRYVSKYWSSFIGYSPYNNPEIILLVVFDEPKKKYYGGEVAAPLFAKVVERYLASKLLKPQVASYPGEEKNYEKDIEKIEKRMTLREVLEKIPEEKKRKKKIVVKGYGFVDRVVEKPGKILIFLSP